MIDGVMVRRRKPEKVEAMIFFPDAVLDFNAWVRKHHGVMTRHPTGRITITRLNHTVAPRPGQVVVLTGRGIFELYDMRTFEATFVV